MRVSVFLLLGLSHEFMDMRAWGLNRGLFKFEISVILKMWLRFTPSDGKTVYHSRRLQYGIYSLLWGFA